MTSIQVSPRIESFKTAIADDAIAAMEELRADLRAAGGPLAEPVGDGNVRYTFVWISADGEGSGRPVTVRCQLFGVTSMGTEPMMRVPGTNVWYASAVGRPDVTTTYQYIVDDPLAGVDDAMALMQDPQRFITLMHETTMRAHVDPFNNAVPIYPGTAAMIPLDSPLDPEHWESVLNGPEADPMTEYFEPARSCGDLHEHRLVSAALDNERTLTVYTPPGYSREGSAYPLVVLLDGELQQRFGMSNAFDHLIARGKIKPVVAVFVHNATPLTRMVEMACNPALATLIADEVLPFLRDIYSVALDATQVTLAGASYGGLASSYVAFERPDAIGNVLSSSGSYWWGFKNDTGAFSFGRDGEPEWLTRQYAAAALKPIRFWIDVGNLEVGLMDVAPGIDQRAANRHFRTMLRAKGYDVVGYFEASGGHEGASIRRATLMGLTALLSG